MKAFWNKVARGFVKAALWAASHPDVVLGAVKAAQHPSVQSVEEAIDAITKQ